MSMDERIRFLLRAATRAECEGDERIARIFRRMAEEARPLGVTEYESAGSSGEWWMTK